MKKTIRAVGHGITLFLLSLVQLLCLTLVLVAVCLIPLGVGLYLTPPLIRRHRAFADRARLLAHDWSGVTVSRPYLPEPVYRPGLLGQAERCRFLLADKATHRDLLWGFADPVVGGFFGLMAFALPVYGLEGILMPAIFGAFRDVGFEDWYTIIHVHDGQPEAAWWCVPLGVLLLLLGLWAAPRFVRAHGLWTRSLLGPADAEALARRVNELTRTRAETIDASAAELRRIERDLHDGAQARLVAMGMTLGAVEQLIEKDPDKARLLLAETRATSVKALNELRDLVRGIHPPVLADRGLSDAVRALSLDSGLDVEVSGTLPRLEPPLESAAYFAVSEVLANAAKHSGARRVWIDLRLEDGTLRIGVTDDGVGGASVEAGSGLRGIERRLAAFDGVLALSSPPGGPTIVTLEIPCAR
ncbi:sensor histidine kinase [Actinocorallia sp. A-T 12471]|uniref:sensor histidine kinase n=1 Tax=Actinocorallia sp. A-T 12471 TaxID=3089813 RepID=UPI0029CE2ED4|nr:sensor histidine kinase [Actinocorallia sp. A-T 12471]MDX6742268.1 sensor histidine kinase [Actinocorallia sp. A-T 12471]